jgi:hypothetical protein
MSIVISSVITAGGASTFHLINNEASKLKESVAEQELSEIVSETSRNHKIFVTSRRNRRGDGSVQGIRIFQGTRGSEPM